MELYDVNKLIKLSKRKEILLKNLDTLTEYLKHGKFTFTLSPKAFPLDELVEVDFSMRLHKALRTDISRSIEEIEKQIAEL